MTARGKGWLALVIGPEPDERRGEWSRYGATWARDGAAGLRAEVSADARGARCRLTFDSRPVGELVTRSVEAAMKGADEWFALHNAARVARSKESTEVG